MKLIAFSGYARSGKDSAVQALVEDGWTRTSFADKLRDFIYALNPMVDVETGIGMESSDPIRIFPTKTTVFLREVIDQYGWEEYKNTPHGEEIRRLLQRCGTEAGRQTLWDSIWVDAALSNLDLNGKYAISDCRFPNEADEVRNRGGWVVRIERHNIGPANNHPSETSLDDYDFDYILYNSGTLEELQGNVKGLAEEVVGCG